MSNVNENEFQTLGSRDGARLILVETLLPASDSELLERRRKRTREKAYGLLLEHVYPDDDPPQLEDLAKPHDVHPIRHKSWLDAMDSFAGRVDEVVRDSELKGLAARIDEECLLDADEADDSPDQPNE